MSDSLKVEPFFHDDTGTWSYVVNQDRDAVVIDPVLDYDPASGRIATRSAQALLQYLRDNDLHTHRILETHAHADHLSSAAVLRHQIGAGIAIGAGIREVQVHFARLFGLDSNTPALVDAFDSLLGDGEIVSAGALRIEVIALPGHTADSLGYRIGGNVFIGDTLFAPDIGTARCDFPGGSVEKLYDSVQRLYALPDDTRLWLCHDYPPAGRERRASISVGESKRDNRMLGADTTMDAFHAARRARDATLPVPRLLYPSLQVNIRGGRLPDAEVDGQRYLRTPITLMGNSDGL